MNNDILVSVMPTEPTVMTRQELFDMRRHLKGALEVVNRALLREADRTLRQE